MIESIQTSILSLTFNDYRYLAILFIGFIIILILCLKTFSYFLLDTWVVLLIGDVLAYIHIKLTGYLFGKHLEKEILESYDTKVAFIFLVTLVLCSIFNYIQTQKGE